ncbi:MAG TPA: uracil-DNA glycosylase [Bacteroidales bacterium]|nr:uracil-DNA glycosylase [Bacteroidales bacterium]
MTDVNPTIEESWKNVLWSEFQSEYFKDLKKFLVQEKQQYTIYPPGPKIFNALNSTPLNKVKAVILGQDPYHGAGQAHGLCFSVPEGIKPPPSLVNIFKELQSDVNVPIPNHGNLETWAAQGVTLLNATLTVRKSNAGSHQNRGWEQFTDQVIRTISEQREHIVFLLWGRYAQAKEQLIDKEKHLILKAAHPSPFSAYNGFFGCRHFSKTNAYLKENNTGEINWEIKHI